MATGADNGATPGPFAEAEASVKELAELEDYYFDSDKTAKMTAVAGQVADCVDRVLKPLRPPPPDLHVRGLFLKGRAVSFLPGQEKQAEDLLSKAIKLQPTLLEAWNALGEVHWNTQSYQRARECFEHALQYCGANAVSLRSLSMVLRAVDGEAAASDDEALAAKRAANFAEALEKAKEAVALDASDPESWETLGNAYVGDFFVNARRPDELNRALIAYAKAEAAYDKLGKSNPSLQLNRGMAAKYIEDYDLALRSFKKAQEIGAANAAAQGQKVVELVQRVAGYAQRKGDLKAKHLKELLDDFRQGDAPQRSLRDLRAGEGSSSAPLVARAAVILDRQDEMPVIVICCDSHGDFFALSLYNAQQSKVADGVVPLKSLLEIGQPKFHQVSVTMGQKTLSYPCVRVGHPGDVTVVGGASLGAAAVQSKFTANAPSREPEADVAAPTSRDSGGSQPEATREPEVSQVDRKREQWIDQEDAKMKKEEAKAKARAKNQPKAKGKTKKKDKPNDKVAAKAPADADRRQQAADASDAELDTTADCVDADTNDKSAPEKVRWSDLDDSDSDDGRAQKKGAVAVAS